MPRHMDPLDSSTMLVSVERWVTWPSVGDTLMIERIFAAVKESCERLQTDYVDVFQVCPI